MTRLVVVDTETTGLGTADQVVEIATATVTYPPAAELAELRWSGLVKPTCPVSEGARRVHGIGEEELADAPELSGYLPNGVEGLGLHSEPEDVILVAHNLSFDVRLLLQSGFPEELLPKKRICTYVCAMQMFPDLARHKNQTLKSDLGIAVPSLDGDSARPHRAMSDVLDTAHLLIYMLGLRTAEEMLKLTSEPLLVKVPFGSKRGRKWSEMTSGYLQWVLTRDFSLDVRRTAEHHLRDRGELI